MLRSRIIPSLLVHKKGLVKTVNFKDPKYVGDPINAVKIFNEKEVDELIVLDIDATVNKKEPDFEMIKNLAALVKQIIGFQGEIVWDSSKPDGTPRKVLDVTKVKSLGWEPAISLKDGIASTIEWYIDATAKGVSRR